MDPTLAKAISAAITLATDTPFRSTEQTTVSGGDINQAYLLTSDQQSYFVKLNDAKRLDMFIAESQALKAIHSSQSIQTPRPITHGRSAGHAFLVLETIEFGPPGPDTWQQMGQQLAQLHRSTADQHGWHRDNTIGRTPQLNAWNPDWATFFCQLRLRPQLALAEHNQLDIAHGDALLERATELLASHKPAPSLLHGDLWKGNASFDHTGAPVVFDPASYYGDRETDLAFSEYFGGFSPEFYQSYQEAWPIDDGYAARKPLYNLYHVLNHANLFGGNYITEAQQLIDHLLQ